MRASRKIRKYRSNPGPLIIAILALIVLGAAGGTGYYLRGSGAKDPNAPPDPNPSDFMSGVKDAIVPCVLVYLGFIFSKKFLRRDD